MKKANDLYKKYQHIIPLIIYSMIYLPWFAYVEETVTHEFNVVHMGIDDKIPFIEVFIVPYLLWYVYVGIVIIYLFLKNKEEYYKVCLFLFLYVRSFIYCFTTSPP